MMNTQRPWQFLAASQFIDHNSGALMSSLRIQCDHSVSFSANDFVLTENGLTLFYGGLSDIPSQTEFTQALEQQLYQCQAQIWLRARYQQMLPAAQQLLAMLSDNLQRSWTMDYLTQAMSALLQCPLTYCGSQAAWITLRQQTLSRLGGNHILGEKLLLSRGQCLWEMAHGKPITHLQLRHIQALLVNLVGGQGVRIGQKTLVLPIPALGQGDIVLRCRWRVF